MLFIEWDGGEGKCIIGMKPQKSIKYNKLLVLLLNFLVKNSDGKLFYSVDLISLQQLTTHMCYSFFLILFVFFIYIEKITVEFVLNWQF